ncbi:MAG: DUF4892 domain-containing protein [Halieaceae bacterium]|nr:DUF4892 domain-containing protein [Halieaceae bacterium]MCP4466194.1 DUF4892 domain-containing protein [Halieaceae bacterium]MCP4841714.1 DUF4892 domain-containing protein [Halieaceae bacterium]MDG2411186.1 DUF4892 domain-containing protein [Halioglobus sp.]
MKFPNVLRPPRLAFCVLIILAGMSRFCAAMEEGPANQYLSRLLAFPHALEVSSFHRDVIAHEVPLGALKKVRGEWRFKNSERMSGLLIGYTWQIQDGFTASQVMSDIQDELVDDPAAEQLFNCVGRACGHSAQWANRVFRERVLYGREDMQRYSVYRLNGGDVDYRLLIYSAARTENRQYLHVELLRVEKEG